MTASYQFEKKKKNSIETPKSDLYTTRFYIFEQKNTKKTPFKFNDQIKQESCSENSTPQKNNKKSRNSRIQWLMRENKSAIETEKG